jgi:hypothetical protein
MNFALTIAAAWPVLIDEFVEYARFANNSLQYSRYKGNRRALRKDEHKISPSNTAVEVQNQFYCIFVQFELLLINIRHQIADSSPIAIVKYTVKSKLLYFDDLKLRRLFMNTSGYRSYLLSE